MDREIEVGDPEDVVENCQARADCSERRLRLKADPINATSDRGRDFCGSG